MIQFTRLILLFLFIGLPLQGRSNELAAELPSYWHDHVKKVRFGFVREDTFVPLDESEMVDAFGYSVHNIRRIHLYQPPLPHLRETPLVFFVVHGTWSAESPEFFSLQSRSFQGLLCFIRELGLRRRCPVEVVSLRWSGEDSLEERERAGAALRNLIQSFYLPNHGYGETWAYGHSHGGNVINIASQDAWFDTAFYFGTPVLEHTLERCRPFNISRLFSFYSTLDPVQKAGSFDRRTWQTFFSRPSDGRTYSAQEDKALFNIRLLIDGRGTGHLTIKDFFIHLWPLIDTVERRYVYHGHLDANICTMPGSHHHKTAEPLIAIRQDLSLRDILPQLHSRDEGSDVIEQLRAELAYSAQQEKLFRARYKGRDIHDSDWLTDTLTSNWAELNATLAAYVPWLAPNVCKEYSLLDSEDW